ncbi:amidohydrolase family protein [Muriicola sp. Z0-33]|uniref:amidohydrolase family protein n=1 Tax=Muriicola sp. Z0-33 TaxID=2816957 RepID=UPI002238A904|nr:amidohydrolase family protein [Muriicola sp. Z0-33]MCW5516003.1 amidohydrolase family protein [Muriicola sp. Z0-33]
MKTKISTFIVIFLLSISCNYQAKDNIPPAKANNETYTGPIIDMHLHAYNEGYPMFGMTHPPTLRGDTFEGVNSAMEHKEKSLERFHKYNIVKAVVTNGESWLDDAPESILIGSANKAIDSLRKQYSNGGLQLIAEMAPFYNGILADDPAVMPYFELAQELDIPVGFHIFPGGPNYGFHLMPEMLGGMRTYNASPLQLENVMVKYPKLRVYIMHGGWPYTDDVKALMYAHPEVYVDIAVVNWILPQEEFNSYIKSLIQAGFGDRIMFGTDQMVWPETIDIAVATVNSANFLTLQQKENIFYNNAAKFLRLPDEEIKKHKGQ